MSTLILIAILLLVAVEAVQLVNNLVTYRHNQAVWIKNIHDLEQRNQELRLELRNANDALNSKQEIDKHAIVVTLSGNYALPKGWEKND